MLAATSILTGCLDPGTGRPPAPGASGAPAYRSSIATVTATDLGSSWRSGCPVGPSALRRVRVAYWGYDGRAHTGDLIIRATEAQHVADAFGKLYAGRFQVERIHPVQRYGSSDDESMAANNTSAFNCRRVTGGSGWSAHAYGTAIDINPVQNPYVTRSGTVLPPAGEPYADRSVKVTGTINRNGVVRSAFAAVGWEWGGDWTDPMDYQHLSLDDR
ncbi:MAG: hypothetical protein JWO77_2601 [Ilumatobacteraceae bacterium]|nr:hypothetical protein [Ilumatobacteraceae bacterium]